jgi:hypothetical protein
MAEQRQQKYKIRGQRIESLLGARLEEIRSTAINDFPGVVVYTNHGVFYSELYTVLPSGATGTSAERKDLTEITQGLVELTTREMAEKGRKIFSVTRIIP